ncbi:MAG: adenylyltransferase/cytidyltransferase family protein [Phycisphaerae bacterium]
MDRKIVDLVELLQRAASARKAGRRLVHCHGCFDLVHPGHIRYLRFARELGDVLVVSVTSDNAVNKGPDRPHIPQELRAESLAALEFVDWVLIDPHPTAAELLTALRPDVYVKGREYAQMEDPRFLREREIVERYGGRVVFHSGDVVFSSTRLVRSLEHDEDLDECRLRTLCSRGNIDLESARAALARLARVRVAVVGDLIRERYISCDASEAAEDAPVLSLQQLGATSYWGGAAAMALQMRALGASATLIASGVEGEQTAADTAALNENDIETHLLPVRREPVEHRTFVADDAKLFQLSDGVGHPLDSTWERHAHALLVDQLAQVDLLVWCDHGYGMVTPGLVRRVTPAARRAGVMVAGCAPGRRGDIRVLEDTDLLAVTERRLREAMHDMGSGLPSVTWNLLNNTRGRRALVGLHKRGLIGFDGHSEQMGNLAAGTVRNPVPSRLRSEFVPALTHHCVDLLGAEEAALAVVALTLVTGGTLAMGTYIAAGAEALAAGRAGRTTVQGPALRAWMDTRPELRPQSRFLPDAATIADIALLAPPLPQPEECLEEAATDS